MKRSDLALAALASAAVPGMKPVAVAALDVDEADGELQQAVVEDATGRRWLVRSPLSAMAGARLQRNDELVRQLSRHVPFKVPAPVGYAVVGPEGSAAVYQHVEGKTLDFTHLPGGTGLAHAVGRAIAAIHNIPAAVFEQQDVPSFDATGCRQRLIAEVDRAAETGRVPTRLLARWEEAFDAAPLWQFATTPVHGAFRGATVLVAFADDDAGSGRVVAVTDWDEAMVADPAADLADLYTRASPTAWESVLDSYALARAQRPDPYLHARARLIAETRRLRGLARSVAEGEEEATRRVVELLRRMDRLTEDEDSLVPTTARGMQQTSPPAGSPPAPQEGVEGDTDVTTSSEAAHDDALADDPDVTTEVPIVRPADAPRADLPQDEGPAWIDDDDEDEDEVELSASTDAVEDDQRVDDAEVRAPSEAAHDDHRVDGDQDDDVAVVDDHDDETDETDEADEDAADLGSMDDDERLHELYGMPSPDQVEPGDGSRR